MRNRKHKRKNKMKQLGIGLLIGTFVLITGSVAAVMIYLKNEVKPNELLKHYVAYINKKEYEKMYEMLDEESQKAIPKEKFISRNQKIYEGIEAENIKLAVQEIKNGGKSSKVVYYTLSMNTVAGTLTIHNEAVFHRAWGKGYHLKWTDSMIFSNLGPTDRVSVQRQEAKRGSIYDRNGLMLAGPGTASSVGVVPGKMNEKSAEDILKLAELLDVSQESIQKKINAKWVKEDSFVPLKTVEKIEETVVPSAQTDEAQSQNIKLQNELLKIPGVMISNVKIRVYPLREKASHLTGYVQNITAEELEARKGKGYSSNSVIGKSGLEKLYEDELRGKDGYEIEITTSDGKKKETLVKTMQVDGKSVVVTIDAKLQSALYEQFSEDKSCSAAINPKTGEVLALVSTPSFNANDFVMGMSDSKWTALNDDEKKPLFNRFRAAWCPGSSFKPIIAAIGVSTDRLNPNEDFGNVGRNWQKDASWGNYFVTTLHAYDQVNMKNALIYSDNIYFAKAALKIGAEILIKQLSQIGFNERIPFDIWMDKSQYANGETINDEVQLADTGYGQGQLMINVLHLASIYSAFVNNGSMIMPYLRYEEQKLPAFWKNNVFTKEAADSVRDALVEVIESPHGTGRACRINDVSLAGKTGTAEIKSDKEDTSGTELGWFAVFTTKTGPNDSIMIVSMAEDVKERRGSTFVVEKDKKVLEQIYLKAKDKSQEFTQDND